MSTSITSAESSTAVATEQEMSMQPPPLLSGHEHRPTFDGSSPPPPPYWRVPVDAPFFEPYSGFASNFYGGVGCGGYFSPLNRAQMLPSLPPPYVYDLGRRLPPPVPFAPHFGLSVPLPMFNHRHRISPFDANFAAPFSPLDPFHAPFNPRSMSTPTIAAAAAVDPAQEMAMQQPLPSGHARRPRFDGRSPPPSYWRVPRAAAPFFNPYYGFASNFYGGGGGGGGYFSQLNRAPMLPSPPPPPPPYAYALGCRMPPPAPFTPHFGLPAPWPMFDHHYRISPFGANFAASFPPLDPFGAPFNPEASGSVIDFNDRNEMNDHSELLRKLCNQVEYYFSDENLVSDWYLKSKMDSEGWVSLKEIASFRKVKHLTKNLLDVIQVLREALSTSLCVEIQDDKVRKSVVVRNPPNEAIPAPGR